MDGTCKWYISAIKPECGDEPVVAHITAVPTRRGPVKKLDEPLPVCAAHKAHVDQLFAQLRTRSAS